MPATGRFLCRLFLGLVCVCGVVQSGGVQAAVAAPATQAYVKYYTVSASYQGSPENLTEIASRFLGDGGRSAEIYNLNSGRVQSDGAGLTDPTKLHTGWDLVLPWDAAGDGVKYGLLPGVTPPKPPAGKPPRPPVGTPAAAPTSIPSKGDAPSPGPTSQPTGGTGSHCASVTASSQQSGWAQTRMAPDQAWGKTRGGGVMVAVVDSGVDSSLPPLSGRVAVGADVTTGTGRGDTDCIGSGTAMADIIAGGAGSNGAPSGIAPDATILPIRVIASGTDAKSADEATGIEVAVSAGASVVALGAFVDLTDAAVAEAVHNALSHDVLVVAGAPTEPAALPSPDGSSGGGALLSVGGVGSDNQLAAAYQSSTVDVVAPGIDVATVGLNGSTVTSSGSQYAVAFAAGQAALVRAAFPDLTAAEVKQRIEQTADRMGAAPDKRYGWGMINPTSAVTAPVADVHLTAVAQTGSGGDPAIRTVVIVFVVLILLGAVAFLVVRSRRRASDFDE